MAAAKCPWHGMQRGLMRIEEDDMMDLKKSTPPPPIPLQHIGKKKKKNLDPPLSH
jgi:hypothetical protein